MKIQKKLKFVIKYPHTVICLIIHLAVCVFLFEKFVTDDPSNYNRCEELLVILHLLVQFFFVKKNYFYFSPVCVTELKIAIATQPAKYLITLQGVFVGKKKNRIEKK